MGLISEAQQDILEAFDDDLSDVVESFMLIKKERKDTAYSAATDEYEYNIEYHQSRGVFEDYGNRELSDEIKLGDIRLICLSNEIGVEPKIDDIIELWNNDFTIVNVKDVFGITYEIQLRGV